MFQAANAIGIKGVPLLVVALKSLNQKPLVGEVGTGLAVGIQGTDWIEVISGGFGFFSAPEKLA